MMRYIGKILFPKLPPDLRQRKMSTLNLIVFVGFAGAGVVGFFFWHQGR